MKVILINNIIRNIWSVVLLSTVCLSSIVLSVIILHALPTKKSDKLLIGYLPSWANWELADIDVGNLDIIELAFLVLDGNQVTFGASSSLYSFEEHIKMLQQLKKEHPQLKLIIAIGGGGVDGFSQLAYTRKSRIIFANSVAEFLAKYDFDGVDIDWEFPVRGSSATKYDKDNLNYLIEELKSVLDKQGARLNKKYFLSVAVGAGPWIEQSFDFNALSMNVDYFGVMSYNHSGAKWSPRANHHAPLYQDHSHWSSHQAMLLIQQHHVLPRQLVFGVPFYARIFTNVSEYNHGINQPFVWDGNKDSASYKVLNEEYFNNNQYSYYFDQISKADYLYNHRDKIFVSYVGKNALSAIVDYVNTNQLRGIMIWELTQDDPQHTLQRIIPY